MALIMVDCVSGGGGGGAVELSRSRFKHSSRLSVPSPPFLARSSPLPATGWRIAFCDRLLDAGKSVSIESVTSGLRNVDFGCGADGEEDWTSEQMDVLNSLFRRTTREGNFARQNEKPRPLPLPIPYKLRPLGLPNKFFVRRPADKFGSARRKLAKNPLFLTKLAAEIYGLPAREEVSELLDSYVGVFMRGSLSATIRELGHYRHPQRALEVYLWQERYPHLWPDDRTLAAVLEVLVVGGEEGRAWNLLASSARTSARDFEAILCGFVKAGKFEPALRVKEAAERADCVLHQRVYAKLIHLASQKEETKEFVQIFVEQLGRFPELKLKLEDCTEVMDACSKIGLYEPVERLFQWWKCSGFQANILMFTALMKARSNAGKYREALSVHWDIEEVGCVPDLPAFRILIHLCLEVGDAPKGLRLFAQMKQMGISPTSDVYSNLVKLCCKDRRYGKASGLLKEFKMMGLATKDEIQHLSSLRNLSAQ